MGLRSILSLAAVALLTGCTMTPGDTLEVPRLQGHAQVTLLQTTDIHHTANGQGHVGAGAPGSPGGYARISAYVEYVRGSVNHPVILVDSGDWSMGTCYDLTLGRQPLALLFMDALRYDCATLGNHEFDYGPAGLARILGSAQSSFNFRTPLVASNLLLNGNPDLAPFLGPGRRIPPARVQVLANGLRVGYLGLMGKSATLEAPAAAPVGFLDFSRDYAAIQAQVDDLRNHQNCHLVIALSHSGMDADGLGGEDVELARQVRGIDVIASGHTHNPLPAAVMVANGAWETRIVSAGAYGSSVSRLDLSYRAADGRCTQTLSENQAMTDANLALIHPGLVADATFGYLVGSADQRLNGALHEVFTRVAAFADYDPQDVAKGLYHPVGSAAQDLLGNGHDPAPGPNGLGNLCADAERAAPNLLLARVLGNHGWTGSAQDPKLPGILAQLQASGFDANPYEAAVVATGVLRGSLSSRAPLSFLDVYNILPLGASPDPTQALAVGYPLLSAYLELTELRKLCAVQLLAQSKLLPPEFYLHLSGLRYEFRKEELNTYFQWATAAGALAGASRQAAAGSPEAQAAMGAVNRLGTDGGAALLEARKTGNTFAKVMTELDDACPGAEQVAANLGVLGQVAAAAADPSRLSGLLMAKAVATVGMVSSFEPGDHACTGPALQLSGKGRHRLAASLYTLLMMQGARARFGIDLSVHKGPVGPELLSGGDLAGLMANRIDLSASGDPAAPVTETKEWMALLLYLGTPPALGGHFREGRISAEYASSADMGRVGSFGRAVRERASSYPAARLRHLQATLRTLEKGRTHD